MKKCGFLRCLARILKKRPILAVRYRCTTALYKGRSAQEPCRVTAHKGRARIDFLGIIAALIAFRLSIKAILRYLKKRLKNK